MKYRWFWFTWIRSHCKTRFKPCRNRTGGHRITLRSSWSLPPLTGSSRAMLWMGGRRPCHSGGSALALQTPGPSGPASSLPTRKWWTDVDRLRRGSGDKTRKVIWYCSLFKRFFFFKKKKKGLWWKISNAYKIERILRWVLGRCHVRAVVADPTRHPPLPQAYRSFWTNLWYYIIFSINNLACGLKIRTLVNT